MPLTHTPRSTKNSRAGARAGNNHDHVKTVRRRNMSSASKGSNATDSEMAMPDTATHAPGTFLAHCESPDRSTSHAAAAAATRADDDDHKYRGAAICGQTDSITHSSSASRSPSTAVMKLCVGHISANTPLAVSRVTGAISSQAILRGVMREFDRTLPFWRCYTDLRLRHHHKPVVMERHTKLRCRIASLAFAGVDVVWAETRVRVRVQVMITSSSSPAARSAREDDRQLCGRARVNRRRQRDRSSSSVHATREDNEDDGGENDAAGSADDEPHNDESRKDANMSIRMNDSMERVSNCIMPAKQSQCVKDRNENRRNPVSTTPTRSRPIHAASSATYDAAFYRKAAETPRHRRRRTDRELLFESYYRIKDSMPTRTHSCRAASRDCGRCSTRQRRAGRRDTYETQVPLPRAGPVWRQLPHEDHTWVIGTLHFVHHDAHCRGSAGQQRSFHIQSVVMLSRPAVLQCVAGSMVSFAFLIYTSLAMAHRRHCSRHRSRHRSLRHVPLASPTGGRNDGQNGSSIETASAYSDRRHYTSNGSTLASPDGMSEPSWSHSDIPVRGSLTRDKAMRTTPSLCTAATTSKSRVTSNEREEAVLPVPHSVNEMDCGVGLPEQHQHCQHEETAGKQRALCASTYFLTCQESAYTLPSSPLCQDRNACDCLNCASPAMPIQTWQLYRAFCPPATLRVLILGMGGNSMALSLRTVLGAHACVELVEVDEGVVEACRVAGTWSDKEDEYTRLHIASADVWLRQQVARLNECQPSSRHAGNNNKSNKDEGALNNSSSRDTATSVGAGSLGADSGTCESTACDTRRPKPFDMIFMDLFGPLSGSMENTMPMVQACHDMLVQRGLLVINDHALPCDAHMGPFCDVFGSGEVQAVNMHGWHECVIVCTRRKRRDDGDVTTNTTASHEKDQQGIRVVEEEYDETDDTKEETGMPTAAACCDKKKARAVFDMYDKLLPGWLPHRSWLRSSKMCGLPGRRYRQWQS